MKILLLTDGIYPFVMGGMQKHSYNLTRYFVSFENNVTLLHCVNDSACCPTHEELEKTIFDDKKDNFKSYCVKFPVKGKIPGHYLRNSKKLSKKYWGLVKEDISSYDFIFSQGFTAWEFLENKEKCPPIGIHFHGYNSLQHSFGVRQKLENTLLTREIKSYAKHTDYLFSLGGNMTNLIRHKLQFPIERIMFSFNGIESHWLSPIKKEFLGIRKFLFVGRPNKIKAIDLIYDCIKSLPHEVEFHFIGDFPEINRLDLQNVKYWGEVSTENELRDIYEKMHVLLCPSYSEGLPTVILEAMALGLPVIATNVGAVEEVVIDNLNGKLIPSGSRKELLNALNYYCEMDNGILEGQSEAAINTISNQFLWQNVIAHTIENIKVKINNYSS